MWRATGVDPTKDIAATSGWARIRSTASRSPWITFNTPSGSPACFHSTASSSDAEGSFSLGFSTKQLPQAMALENIHSGTMAGKLNGVMPATTPSIEIDGATSVRDLETQYDIELPDNSGFETVAGFILWRLGHIPTQGEKVEDNGRRFTVVATERNRIARVRIEKIEPAVS